MLEAVYSAGGMIIGAGEVYREKGRLAQAERFRLIGQMLIAISFQIREPLLASLWENTAEGNSRHTWGNEPLRHQSAVAAVYIRVKYDKLKIRAACKEVEKATGEAFETLRNPFKGKGKKIPEFEASEAGKGALFAIEAAKHLHFGGILPSPSEMYEYLIRCAKSLATDMKRDDRRIFSEKWG